MEARRFTPAGLKLFGRIGRLHRRRSRRRWFDRRFRLGRGGHRAGAVHGIERGARRRWRWAPVNDQVGMVHDQQGRHGDGCDDYCNDHRFSEHEFHAGQRSSRMRSSCKNGCPTSKMSQDRKRNATGHLRARGRERRSVRMIVLRFVRNSGFPPTLPRSVSFDFDRTRLVDRSRGDLLQGHLDRMNSYLIACVTHAWSLTSALRN